LSQKDKIILSKKHGVNPTIPVCYYCGKEKNEVALLGKLPGDAKADSKTVVDMSPCDDCAELMKKGVMLIGVRDGEKGPNPYRTGSVMVVSQEAAERIFGGSYEKNRACFVHDSILKQLIKMAAEAETSGGVPEPAENSQLPPLKP